MWLPWNHDALFLCHTDCFLGTLLAQLHKLILYRGNISDLRMPSVIVHTRRTQPCSQHLINEGYGKLIIVHAYMHPDVLKPGLFHGFPTTGLHASACIFWDTVCKHMTIWQFSLPLLQNHLYLHVIINAIIPKAWFWRERKKKNTWQVTMLQICHERTDYTQS